jgi:hypothetical protein
MLERGGRQFFLTDQLPAAELASLRGSARARCVLQRRQQQRKQYLTA